MQGVGGLNVGGVVLRLAPGGVCGGLSLGVGEPLWLLLVSCDRVPLIFS